MLKRICLVLLLVFGVNASAFDKMASSKPELVQEGKSKKWCQVCGMSLKKFYKTSYIGYTKAGKAKQFCSIRCFVTELEQGNIVLDNAKVLDTVSEKYILAKDAFYAVGSKVSGTMSKVSKLAFKKEIEAKDFIEQMGGEIKKFDEVIKLAKASMSEDIAMTNKKRAKMMYPMGKKIFNSKCQMDKFDLKKYTRINELKPVIMENCEGLKEKQAQAVALHLWDELRFEKDKKLVKVEVDKEEKCPVCGMFAYKYPRWAAQIFHGDKHFSFDGVKDLVKFMHNPKAYGFKDKLEIKKILVTDYYSQSAIDGKKAFYVVGSDVLGPMGHELIPFAKKSDAETFLKDHKGEKILTLKEITDELISKLDGKAGA